MSKAQRQHRLARILAGQSVTSQGHLVELLAEAGITATQATVSRDLGDIGAVTVRLPGGASVLSRIPICRCRRLLTWSSRGSA